MAQTVLSNQSVRVNNDTVRYKANTLSTKSGRGEISVKGVAIGGGLSDIAVSENVETFVGEIKFELFTTPENKALFRQWKDAPLFPGNKVKDFGSGDFESMSNAVVTNDPDQKTGVDESFEVIFQGNVLT